MSGRTTRYQGGSIVSFIIIAVIVTAALGIGLHILRQRSEQSRISSTTSQDVPPELPGAPSDDAKDPAKNGTDTETFPSSSKKDTTSTDDKNKGKDTDTATESTPKNDAKDTGRSESTPSSSAATVLPETGPEHLLIVPVLAAVAYTAVAYANSSRALSRLN